MTTVLRLLDIIISTLLIGVFTPFLVFVLMIHVLLYRSNPFFIATRIGVGGSPFNMIKLTTMCAVPNYHSESTKEDDPRITKLGKFLRRYKIDELPQLFNVVVGEMSLVGPRPNVASETDTYDSDESRLLSVPPGITDYSSIVFADESAILKGSDDPHGRYIKIIRPWKKKLGLVYVDNRNIQHYCGILFATAIALVNREYALKLVSSRIKRSTKDVNLASFALREHSLD